MMKRLRRKRQVDDATAMNALEQEVLRIQTPGRGLIDITRDVAKIVARRSVQHGLCNVFVQHTSASLLISENADPAVCRDLERFLARLVPDGDALFEHDAEGPDDMPAHVRSMLTCTSITIPTSNGRLLLGTWQGIYLWEHRHQGHERTVVVTV
jgi:secondary thiamine-phosphate synthase enzyme